MGAYTEKAGLQIDQALAAFLEEEALPGSGLAPEVFWAGLAAAYADFAPENAALLARRQALQDEIDAWHRARRGAPWDSAAYESFLSALGYLAPEGPDFTLSTTGVDPEIAAIAGPQLVVPLTNARYALNAANARYGSLYDALYGSDALGSPPPPGPFDPARGAQVIAWAKAHLDRVLPLAEGPWAEVTGFDTTGPALRLLRGPAPATALQDPKAWAGHSGTGAQRALLFRVNGLHLELILDPSTPVGATDPAHIADLRLEAALSAIMDGEDSVATVDGADKALAYRHWLGLMRGTLTASFTKGGQRQERALAPDTPFTAPGGQAFVLKRRALLLNRNVGLLMTTPAVRSAEGADLPEGILDAFVTPLCALHDRARPMAERNSQTGAIYIVKPKLHGPEEAAFTARLFARVESVLGLPPLTVKLGLMDEERRTSVNLKETIRALDGRLVFINTGFLDRTGDEIHTSLEAGPMIRKGAMKAAPWLAAYESRNVALGLALGLSGRAQIGKGMWAAPDRMAAMLAEKGAHPQAGASCAWVPSPTAATLHATHYHLCDVAARQRALAAAPFDRAASRSALLTPPLATGQNLSPAEMAEEVETNVQGILGYVVRWVDQGIGCSKVPDLSGVGLMEDRATCRISAQALANWLHHAWVSPESLEAALRKMAALVDGQNAGDPAYRPMAPTFTGPAFQAARALIFEGRAQPSGYTEPLLHRYRLLAKAAGATKTREVSS